MKKIYWLFLLPLFFLNSCLFQNKIKLSKQISEYNVEVDGISEIEASGIYHITILKGDVERVDIKCNENLKEFLDIYQEGSTLYLEMDNISTSSDVVLEATVTVLDLKKIDISGVVKVKMENIKFENMAFELSGASEIKASDYKGNKLTAEASGASNVKINGSLNTLYADFSGASDFKGKHLNIHKSATIIGSGACKFSIANNNDLEVDLSGASTLNCYGKPTMLKQDVSGASKVNIKN